MVDASKIKEHAAVVGSDGVHVGTVDHLDGDHIKLTKNDPAAKGAHHLLPLSSVASIDEAGVRLNMTGPQAMAAWQKA